MGGARDLDRVMSKRMRVCWIKAGGLLPLDFGGRIRSFHMVRSLAQRHSVTLVTFYRRQDDDKHAELAPLFEKLVLVPLDLPENRSWKDFLDYGRNVFSGFPHSMAKYYQPQLRRVVRELLDRERFDVIVCDFIYPAGLIDWRLPTKKVLFTHNVEAEVWQRQAHVASRLLWRVASRLEFRAMTAAEARYVPLADHVVAVSEANRKFFSQYVSPSRITVVSTGVDTDKFRPNPDAELPNHLVFTGSYDWAPNADAMEWFYEKILPLIRQEIPDVQTWAVGKNATARMRQFAEQDRAFHVTGLVDDILPYMDKASVYVVPMRSGSGTRLKVFEAMASGKAIVATRTGAEGLPVEHGRSIILADTEADFAAQVVRLLRDPARRRQLGREARAQVEGRASWDAVGSEFETILKNTVGVETP